MDYKKNCNRPEHNKVLKGNELKRYNIGVIALSQLVQTFVSTHRKHESFSGTQSTTQ